MNSEFEDFCDNNTAINRNNDKMSQKDVLIEKHFESETESVFEPSLEKSLSLDSNTERECDSSTAAKLPDVRLFHYFNYNYINI
jgi:hypothetical protein